MTLYTPGGVAAVVVIAPVVVFNAMPAGSTGPVGSKAIVEFAAVAPKPFTKSLVRMLAIGVDGVPATAVPVSATGLMPAVTVIVSVVLAQFGVGVALSHNLYTMVYVPGGVVALVLIAPVAGFNAMPAPKPLTIVTSEFAGVA